MNHTLRQVFLLVLLSHSVLAPASAQSSEKETPPHQLRLIFLSCPKDVGELKLVSRNEDKTFEVHHELKPRAPFISSWIETPLKTLYLAEKVSEKTLRVGTISLREGAQRTIALLRSNGNERTYSVELLNPDELDFEQGTTLVANYSKNVALVALGDNRVSLKPGERKVLKPGVESNGMFRAMVGHIDAGGKQRLSYDRYVAASNQGREFLLLMPDEQQGLTVFPIVEFGPFN